MLITLAVLGVTIIFFIYGRVRADLVALCALMILVLAGILTPHEALSSFSDPLVMMIIGLFVVSGAILRTGLAKMAGSKILKLAGSSEERLFFLLLIVTTLMGAFISNTGTVALMMPIVVSMAMQSEINIRRLLMPLAFAGSIGGMFTLIGAAPNLVIEGVLSKNGYTGLKFFSFTPVGLTVFAVGISGFWILSKLFLSKKIKITANAHSKTLKELGDEYRIRNKAFTLKITKSSPLAGKTLQELQMPEKYGVSIARVIRKSTNKRHFIILSEDEIETAGPSTLLNAGSIMEVLGSVDEVKRFAKENSLTIIKNNGSDQASIGIAEAVILPNSKLVDVKIRESGFRKKYGVNILAIHHHKEYKSDNLADETMRSGDVLLVQGRWEDLARLKNDYENIILVGEPLEEASKVTLNHKAPLAAVIMLGMIASMVAGLLPPVIAIMSAALLMIITGCLRNMEEAYKLINWESVVLLASMLPMSVALQKTGTVDLITGGLVHTLGGIGIYALLAGIYFCTSLLTLFISNTATAVLFAPIALQAAQSMNVSPYPFMLAVSVAASMCFTSPFSTPSNVMVMKAGRYSFLDYVKIGGPMQIIMGIVMVFVLPLLFPF